MRSVYDSLEGREAFGYIKRDIEVRLEGFAYSRGFDPTELAKRVGAFLLGVSERSDKDSVRVLQGTAADVDAVVGRKMEVGSHARNKMQKKSSKSVTDDDHEYWNLSSGKGGGSKGYWAKMTPKQRSAEVRRRMAKWPKASVAKFRHKKGRKS